MRLFVAFRKTRLHSHLLTLTIITCVTFSCSQDNLLGPNQSAAVAQRSRSPVLDINFNHESFTYYRYDGELEHDLDFIATIPDIYAESVDFQLFENGEIRLEVTKLEPSERVLLPAKPLEDPSHGSSRPGEFHPQPLTEPYVTVSRHTALR